MRRPLTGVRTEYGCCSLAWPVTLVPPRRYRWESESDALVCRRQHDFDGESEVRASVLQVLDSATEYDARDSETTIFEQIDPDALDDLFGPVTDGDRGSAIHGRPLRYHGDWNGRNHEQRASGSRRRPTRLGRRSETGDVS